MRLMRPAHGAAPIAGPRNVVAPPILPAAIAAPLSLAEQPSTPPQVSYRDGMLTIVAQNSSLGDILREVHKSTGAAIDVPANATERVVARIGPGPARDVLASLLNGSTFDYVMLGSVTDPASLASVMLTMKTGVGAHSSAETAANVYQPPPQQTMSQQAPMALGGGPGGPVVQPAQPNDEEADAEEEKDEEDPAEEDQAQNGAVTPPDASQANGGPKTPEQILEMLRQHPPGQVVPGQQVIQPPQQQQPNDDN